MNFTTDIFGKTHIIIKLYYTAIKKMVLQILNISNILNGCT